MSISLGVDSLKINNIRKSYNNLIQYAIKKGHKYKIEVMFKSLLFYIASQAHASKITNQSYEDKISSMFLKALEYTKPKVNVKAQRKGSKNIYIPISLTPSYSKYKSSHWLITHAKLKTNKEFYKNLAEEFLESSQKKSLSFKKCYEMHKLSVISLNNFKKKSKNFDEKKLKFFDKKRI